MLRISKLLLFVLMSVFIQAQDIVSGGLLKSNQAVFDVLHYSIMLDIDMAQKSIAGNTIVKINIKETTPEISFDLINVYSVKNVWIDKTNVDFTHEHDMIYLKNQQMLTSGLHDIRIEYSGAPPIAPRAPWKGGIQWEKDDNNDPWIAFSCQNEGAKILFPCKDHPSDKPDEGAEMKISVPKGLKVAGPGRLIKEETKGQKSVYTWKTSYPIHNYSLVFNVAKYHIAKRNYVTIDGNHVPMEYYVLPENIHRAEKHLNILAKSVRVQEKYFGEFPFINDKIGLVETPHLGMEHQTMNAYGNQYRYTTVGGEDFDWLLYHELGHEWWGNKVSNSDWAHFWIQEGICVFADWLYFREKEGIESFHAQAKKASYSFVNKYPIVRDSSADSGKAYQPDIYGKGAFFMRSLSFIIGEEKFFEVLKSFIGDKNYTYGNTVTTEIVENYFSTKSNMDLKAYFDFFLKTTDRLTILVKEVRPKEYDISFKNYSGNLPLEIGDGNTIKKVMISSQPIRIISELTPVIDPTFYYFKSVVYE
jgi:aminopeptidase N